MSSGGSGAFQLTLLSYTKQRLTHLHENIFVQRSPSHFVTGTFYWAHVSTVYLHHQTTD